MSTIIGSIKIMPEKEHGPKPVEIFVPDAEQAQFYRLQHTLIDRIKGIPCAWIDELRTDDEKITIKYLNDGDITPEAIKAEVETLLKSLDLVAV